MSMKLRNLTLPEFAFLESWEGDSELDDRYVILHIRSASIVEIIEEDKLMAFNEGVLSYEFTYSSVLGVEERFVAGLHYCATLDPQADRGMIVESILKPTAEWFCRYLDWEDGNILLDKR